MRQRILFTVLAVLAAGCAPVPAPMPPTDDHHVAGRPVERLRLPDTPTPVEPPGIAPETAAPALPPVAVPPGALYVCVVDSEGVRKQTAIEYAPKVGALCAKHPEMGPCQYERNACRAGGGRVFAAGGAEITMQTEAEYDKRVLRV